MRESDYAGLIEMARAAVEEELRRAFDSLSAEASSVSGLLSDLSFIARDFTLRGGKRLRAVLVLAGYWSREWGSGDIGVARSVMAAIELLQSYLLVHDDIMDRDEVRRGGPTAHAWFRRRCVEAGMPADCPHYGISQAITAGDMLEAMAVAQLSRAPREVLPELLARYSQGLRRVAFGQYLDVLASALRLGQVREEDVLLIHKLKTASYTVELPLHLGAIASGKATPALLAELSSYATPAGLAFQLRDDVIGLFGDPSVTGKPAGSDVIQRKKTLLVVKAYEAGSEAVRRRLEEIYDSGRPVGPEDVEFVKKAVVETGSLDYTNRLIDSFVGEARRSLERSREISPEARGFLGFLLDRLAYRER